MKIAVTYENGNVFQHFGKTENFIVYEVENGEILNSQVINTNGEGHGALAGFLAAEEEKNQHGSIDHTIWEGIECKGYTCAVYSHGNLVFDGKDFVGKKGAGQFLKQKKVNHKGPELV